MPVNLPLPRQRGEVLAVFLERLELVLRVLVGDPLVAAELGECLEESFLAAVRLNHLVAVLPEERAESVEVILLVVDDQNPERIHADSSSRLQISLR